MKGTGLDGEKITRNLVLDTSGLRCLSEVPGILTSELRSQVSCFHLCSFCQAFIALGFKSTKAHVAKSDSLTPSLQLPLLPHQASPRSQV